jgi:rRNA maturation RNase YbeY
MKIKAVNDQDKIPVNITYVKALCRKTLTALGIDEGSVISVSLVSPARIKALNKKYFKKHAETDVISLSYKNKMNNVYSGYLGEVVICPKRALENAREYDNTFLQELALYIVHGILHLLGYEDTSAEKREKMQKKEKEILGKIWRR